MVHILSLIICLVGGVNALNDWSIPCLSGVCSYDLPTSPGTASGSVKIWGATEVISDITTAAGWVILDCSPDTLAQSIRLVCKNGTDGGCAHLHNNAGPVGKLVRLPEACGKMPFARVARAWISEDQTIPSAVARSITRRDGTQPQVHALHIDTNFSAVDSSKFGTISFAVKGANIPGAAGDIDTSTVATKRSRIHVNRGIFSFVGDAIGSIKNLNNLNANQSKTLDPFDVDQTSKLFSQQLSCPPITVSVGVNVNAKAHAVATIGVAASGTVIPPQITDFALITSLTADLSGTVNLTADVIGTLDSGKIKIFEVGVPGLDFPGILTVGPTFEVNAQALASLDLGVDLTLGLNYHVKNAELIFPPPNGAVQDQSKAFQVGDTPLKLSVTAVRATGKIEAHLIPSLNLKLAALGDIVNTGVFLELDTSASVTLSAAANITARDTEEPSRVNGRWWKNGRDTSLATSSTTVKRTVNDALASNTSVGLGGCFEIDAGLGVNAGANADFFGLFGVKTKVPLFSRKFALFKKCFGNAKRSIRELGAGRPRSSRFASRRVSGTEFNREKRALGCSATVSLPAVPVVDGIVPASSATIKL